jgi:pimeloyl-ACP methyl ester carboxylesterase
MKLDVKSVTLGDIDIAYLEKGEGRLIVCLHGFPDTAYSWQPLMERLADHGHRVVAPFLRGYAPSGLAPDGNYEGAANVRDITRLHEVLGGDSDAILIGEDVGAAIAYTSAAAEPDRWSRIVGMSTPPRPFELAEFLTYGQLKRSWYPFFFQTDMAPAVLALNDFEIIRGLWESWAPDFDTTPWSARAVDALRGDGNRLAAVSWYRHVLNPPDVPELARERALVGTRWKKPTLYFHGVNDQCVPVALPRAAHDQFPDDTVFHYLDGVGHFPHVEAPGRIHSLFTEWMTT